MSPKFRKSNPSTCQTQKKRAGGGVEQDECTSSRNNHPTIQKHIERGGARRGKTKVTIKKKNMCILHRHVERVVLVPVYHHDTASISQQHVSGRIHHIPSNPHTHTRVRTPRFQGTRSKTPKPDLSRNVLDLYPHPSVLQN